MPIRGRTVAVLFFLLLVLASAGLAGAHGDGDTARGVPAEARARAEQLTLDLAGLNAQRHHAPPGKLRAAIEAQLRQLAIDREAALTAILEDDPSEFLRLALPATIRASLPAGVRAHVEDDLDIEGTLDVLHEDGVGYSRYVRLLHTPLGTLTLEYEGGAPDLLTGSRVRVRGVRLGQTVVLPAGGGSTQTVSVAALPNTFGAQRTLVILVNFPDKATQPFTVADARAAVFTTASNFFLENSTNQTWLTGDVAGWYTIAQPSTVCDHHTLASQAEQKATAAGVSVSTYSRRVYVFPKNACGWLGVGTVGGSPSQAWSNGSLSLGVIGHELGHNLGLYHSHSWDCGAVVLGGACTEGEYGDKFDLMGGSSSNHFNAFQKERLGWLNQGASPGITTVTASGTFTLAPYESPGGIKALKIRQNAASNTNYYLEFRQPIGFDASVASYPSVVRGVLAHTGSTSNGDSSRLLDMTPATSSWYDPALVTGATYHDASAGVTITPLWTNSTNAGVNVTFGASPCVKAAPTMTVSPEATQWAAAGTAVVYTVTVTNHDDVDCAASSFAVTATVPAGWTATYGGSPMTIAPGVSASATVRVTSPTSAAPGFYTIGVTAKDTLDATRSSTASRTYVVGTSLTVTPAADRAVYLRGATVTITTTVRAGTSPVASAGVTVTITRANGSKVALLATTGSTGVAVVTYRITNWEKRGVWQVTSSATTGSVSGTGATSFTVQ